MLNAAGELLETGESFSLRAVARGAGVSAAAPYRHFADREALESALAVEGFSELTAALGEGGVPSTSAALERLAVVYVRFALDRPGLFKLMFGQPCDDDDDERVRAAERLHALLGELLASVFPQLGAPDLEHLAVGAWSLVHGLAFLHLDGKLPPTPRAEVDARVRSALASMLTTGSAR